MGWKDILKIEWEIPEDEKINRQGYEWFDMDLSYDTVEEAEKELERLRSKGDKELVYRLVRADWMGGNEPRAYVIQGAVKRTGEWPEDDW